MGSMYASCLSGPAKRAGWSGSILQHSPQSCMAHRGGRRFQGERAARISQPREVLIIDGADRLDRRRIDNFDPGHNVKLEDLIAVYKSRGDSGQLASGLGAPEKRRQAKAD